MEYMFNDNFSNPFMSIANKWMPTTNKEMFELCEWMHRYCGIFRGAVERIARMFFTDYIYDETEETKTTSVYKDFLSENGKFKKTLINIGIDYLVYGNSLVALYLPFIRILNCQKCKTDLNAISVEDLDYIGEGKFTGVCPSCGGSNFTCKDTEDTNINNINLIRLPPADMEMIHNRISGNSTYFWNMESSDRTKYKNGKGTILVSETPLEILDMVRSSNKLKFKPDSILHTSQSNLAGNSIEWGMPFAISCFPLVFYIAILRKANEAISMDYIIPLRIIYPQPLTSGMGPDIMKMKDYISRINQIIRDHRTDPDAYHTSPIPLGYQVLGAEKRSLMISDDIEMSNKELLNAIGFPAEMYFGTMQLGGTSMALRLLDNTFGLTAIYNSVIQWTLRKISYYLKLSYSKVSMMPLKYIDDDARKQVAFQLASADKISDISLLELCGYEYEKEQRRKIKQQQILSKIQKELESKKSMETQQGTSGGGSNTGAGTPSDLMAQAEAKAQEILMIQDPREQEATLRSILSVNPLLHDAVKGSMDRVRNKLRTQGMHMLLEQQQQQQ